MLTEEDDVEIHALKARGWSVSAIARHTGRDRKTVRKYLAGDGGLHRREPAASCVEPFRGYIAARFAEDPHLPAVTLLDELAEAGFDRSYPTLVRELRRLELRPVCLVCQQRRGRCTEISDKRRRRSSTVGELGATEPLRSLPTEPFPARILVARKASRSALVAFEGNRYSVPPAYAGRTVSVLASVGDPVLRIVSGAGELLAEHHRAPSGAEQTVRSREHARLLEAAVLDAFTTDTRCRNKVNRPPGGAALAELAKLRGIAEEPAPVISLARYAQLAEVAS